MTNVTIVLIFTTFVVIIIRFKACVDSDDQVSIKMQRSEMLYRDYEDYYNKLVKRSREN